MPLIKINDKEIEAKSGSQLLQVALDNGIDIPHYCYHPALSIAGSCRMCQVEIEGMPGLAISCNVTVNDAPEERKIDGKYDLVVQTETEEVKDSRRTALEFLLLNHPLDCPVCDQAGECYLQDYSFAYGNAHSRFGEPKRVNPKKELGPEVWIYPNRCVMCSRCIRFCEEVVGDPQLIIRNRGYDSIIDVREGEPIDNLLSGNVVDICPVGSLVSNDFLHKTRVWNLKSHESVCNDCSVGCNIRIETKDNEIQRIKPRKNDAVNGDWICDIGRLGYNAMDDLDRVTSPMLKDGESFKPVGWSEAFELVGKKLGGKNKAGVVGSAYMTNEENYLLGKLAAQGMKAPDSVWLYPGQMEGEPVIFKSGFRISPDRTPNRIGACHMLDNCIPVLDDINKKANSLYFVHGGPADLLTEEYARVLGKLKFLVVQSTYMSDVARLADLVLPATTYAEKYGTMTNDTGRVQKLTRAVEPPNGTKEDWEVIAGVMKAVDSKSKDYGSVTEITAEITEKVEGYEGLTFNTIGTLGVKVSRKTEVEKAGSAA